MSLHQFFVNLEALEIWLYHNKQILFWTTIFYAKYQWIFQSLSWFSGDCFSSKYNVNSIYVQICGPVSEVWAVPWAGWTPLLWLQSHCGQWFTLWDMSAATGGTHGFTLWTYVLCDLHQETFAILQVLSCRQIASHFTGSTGLKCCFQKVGFFHNCSIQIYMIAVCKLISRLSLCITRFHQADWITSGFRYFIYIYNFLK